MPIATPLNKLRVWRQRSLANVFALQAAIIAIVSSLVVALISLGVIYWTENATLQEQLQDKAHRWAERVEAAVDVMDSAIYDLSTNAMFVTALLDSQGRKAYITPFLDNYRLPISASSALALCDINGIRLAGSRSELSQCHADSPLFKQVIADGMAQRELVTSKKGRLAWVLYRGVVFPYTHTVEGVVVTQLDLQDLVDAAAQDLDLQEVALMQADTQTLLVSAQVSHPTHAPLKTAQALVYKGRSGATPFPIMAVVKNHRSPFSQKLVPLVLSYGLGSLVLVLAVVYWAQRVSRKTVKPLTDLTQVAMKISTTVDLNVPIPTRAAGEIGQLARALQVMVNTLRASEASLETKVAQRTEALQKSEAAAEAANLAKSRFLATMSHEIRTPMNGILGMAQMLQSPVLSPSERQDYAQVILSSGQTLMTLLNDILDISKIEAGKFQLDSTPCAPDQLVFETQALFFGAAKTKGLQLDATWRGLPGPHYLADAQRLRQMLANLVGNAIKFTAQGTVHIEGCEIGRTGDTALLELSVSDTGCGVAPDQLSRLFLPFTQVDSSTTREYGGTGLGLSIVHQLARLMGGEVGVQSTLGQGSRFWFRFQAQLAPANDPPLPAHQTGQGEALAPQQQALRGRVLVAEDNAANCAVIDAMLSQLGLHRVLVRNGLQALNAITQGDAPDLVLMDLHMPVMDGYAATALIRQWEVEHPRARLPIIALTADAFADDRERCQAAGMNEVLTKPISLTDLHTTLVRWLPQQAAPAPQTPPPPPAPAPSPLKPLPVPAFMALVAEITPLLANNKFDALARFKALQTLVAGTALATETDEIAGLLAELHFDLALARLHQMAATHVEQKLT